MSRPTSIPRIAFFDHTAALGGGEIALQHLVRRLTSHHTAPLVILGEEGPLVERLRTSEMEVAILPLRSNLKNTRKDALGVRSLLRLADMGRLLAYAAQLRTLLVREKVDLLVCNSLKADILGGIAARLAGIPVVWYVRDRIAPEYLPAPVVTAFRALARVLPSALIANSRSTRATLPDACDVTVIHDGLPELQERSQAPSDPPIVGIVGRISPWKGQHIFLEAAARVADDFPAVRFQIIGAPLFGEEEYAAFLHKRVNELGLSSRVEFTGFQQDVFSFVEKLSVLVHASTIAEPFGQVVIEGMAAEVPVIAVNLGGPAEIIEHGVSGMLVPRNDPTSLATTIARVLANPVLAGRISRAGREVVRDHFMIEQTAASVAKVCGRLWNLANSPKRNDSKDFDLFRFPNG